MVPIFCAHITPRGTMVEWLEHFAVVWKVTGSSPAQAKKLENSHCPPGS